MKEKITDILVIAKEWLFTIILFSALLAPFLICGYFVVQGYRNSQADVINAEEIRGYVALFMLFMFLITFGVLRLYKAIIGASRYIGVLKGGLDRLYSETQNWVRTITSNNKMAEKTGNKIEKSVDGLTNILRENIAEIKRTNKNA